MYISTFFTIQAQDSLGNYVFNKLDQQKKLLDYQVSFFHQDEDGYIWMSSNSGFYRYDGKIAKAYRPNNLKHSFAPIVNSNIFKDRQGNGWFSTIGGLHRIDQQYDTVASFQIYCDAEKQYLNSTKLFHLHQSKDQEEFWLYNDSTWYKISLKNPKKATPYQKLTPGLWRIKVILDQKKEPSIIAGSFLGYGFYLYDLKHPNRNKLAIKEKKYLIANLINEADSILWLASMTGLLQYDLKKKRLIRFIPTPINKLGFFDVHLWGSEYLLVGSIDGNIYRMTKNPQANFKLTPLEQWKNIAGQYQRILPLNKTFIDNWHNLWVVSWRTGLHYTNLEKSYFSQLIPNKQGFAQGQYRVGNMVTDRKGQLWVVIKENDVFKIFTSYAKGHLSLVQEGSTTPLFLFADHQGSVWVAKADGLKKLDDPTIFIKFNQEIAEIDLAPKGFAIVRGVREFLLFDAKNLSWKNLNLPQNSASQIDHQSINSVFIDKQGYCFINHHTNELLVCRLHDQQLEFVASYKDLGRVNQLIADIHGNGHWVASSNGLFKLQLGKKQKPDNFSKKYSVLDQNFNGVLQDRRGNLWLSTTENILQFNPANGKTMLFSESDGVLGGQYQMGVCIQNQKGQLFFGSTYGINMIEPDHLVLDSHRPHLFCEKIQVNGQSWSNSAAPDKMGLWKFAANERNLTFTFSTIDYISPGEAQFRYRLKKHRFWDKLFKSGSAAWIDLGNNNTFSLPDLAKGRYELEVMAANSDGIWMEQKNAKRYSFRVKPYWYETAWARTLWLLLLLALAYLYYRYKMQLLKQKAHLKDTELKVLRLQMNPHFIYNCLASIQRYVIIAKVDQANSLITSFSKLMRKVLIDSVKSNQLIADEIELLESYLRTESLRFDSKFDYAINVLGAELDPEEIAVPTMIMQPFVENAIIHGMAKLDGKGYIQVMFAIRAGMLECIVEDNGGGFSKSPNRAHESKAIEITEQRLKLLPKTGKEAASLKLIDLKDIAPDLSGVRVTMRLPLNLATF